MSPEPAPAIEAAGLRVERDDRVLLHPLDLAVEAGTWLCVVGPNGAGKSTLLRALTRASSYTGSVRLDGRDQRGLSPRDRARLVAVVPQHPTIPAGATVTDYVLLGRTAHIPILGTESRADRVVAATLIDRLDLTPMARQDMGTLSGGERQRAVIARALAQEAPILVLDEPTTGLDLGHQQQVLALIDQLRHERGLTVVSAMHDLTLAAQHAQRFLLLDRGHVVASGAAPDVFDADALGRVFGASVAVLDDDGDLVIVPRRRPGPSPAA
ncbi:MAG: ABC transporter ATP-binding protein [Acidimicrobiales bacterium]